MADKARCADRNSMINNGRYQTSFQATNAFTYQRMSPRDGFVDMVTLQSFLDRVLRDFLSHSSFKAGDNN